MGLRLLSAAVSLVHIQRRGAGETMDETNEQRAEDLIHAETTESLVQPRYRCPVVAVPVLPLFAPGWVAVHIVAVAVQMCMESICSASA